MPFDQLDQQTIRQQITAYAAHMRQLHMQVHATFAQRGQKGSPGWQKWSQACEAFHAACRALGGLGSSAEVLYQQLQQHDAYAIEYALCFIELRPYFFRSGYIYQRLMRKLNHSPLSDSQRARYQCVRQRYLDWVWRKSPSVEEFVV